MPDLVGRSEWERQFSRRLTRLERQWLDDLMEKLGDPPDLTRVPEAYWGEMSATLQAEIVPVLTSVFLQAAEAMVELSPIGVEWDLVHASAVAWSREYGFTLVSGITANTRQFLQQAVGRFFSDQLTIGQLRDLLGQKYGPVRADMIASTEITRAAVQGELNIVSSLQQYGIEMVSIWNTSNDEHVCPICEPLNGKAQGDGWIDPPPAHPRCRCWLSHEYAEPVQ
jgi:hypothetical protein